MTVGGSDDSAATFKELVGATDFRNALASFNKLCEQLDVDRNDHSAIYGHIKKHIRSNLGKKLFQLLDARIKRKEYKNRRACAGHTILIIGAGPCGLRMAIEGALLGARVVVVEMRDYITRNNVLKLWPFVIDDLKALGAKVFYPQFCTGSLDHISIRCLQMILLKLSLLLGVEVFAPAKFVDIVEPETRDGVDTGWRARFEPEDHPLHQCQFDAIVGADGKRNTLPGYKRKCMRGKLAIGITANFVNRRTRQDQRAKEISGLLYVYDQEFFDQMKKQCDIELENLVYYKNETHYFVVTAKKSSLLKKGVLTSDYDDTRQLLSRENVVRDNLLAYIKETADFSTKGELPQPLEFQRDHHDQEDVAIFDFTAMNKAEHSCRGLEKHGHRLITCIVGDTLLEPFWPTGSGCGRGFLSVFDAIWTIRAWCLKEKPPLEIVAQQESVYKLLSQTKASDKYSKDKFCIDPITRYGTRLNLGAVKPDQVSHLFENLDQPTPMQVDEFPDSGLLAPPRARRKRSVRASVDTTALLCWFQETLNPYSDVVHVLNLASSWHDGMAFCALADAFKPGSINVRSLDRSKIVQNCQQAFDILVREAGVSPMLSPCDFLNPAGPDPLALLSYLSHLHARLVSIMPKPAADDICEPDDVTEIDAVDGIDTVDGIVSDHANGEVNGAASNSLLSPRAKRSRRPSATALLASVTQFQGLATRAGVLDTLTEMPQESPPLSPVACSPPPPLPVSTPRIIFTPEEQFEKMRDEIDHERQKSPVTSPRLARRRQVKSEADLPAYVPLTRLNRKPSKDAENSSRNTPNETFKSSITFSNGDTIPESPPMTRRTEDRVSPTPSPKPVSFDSPPIRQKSLDVSPTRMSYDSPPMRQRSLKTQNAFDSPPTRPKSFTSSQSLDRPLLKPKPRDISPSQPSRTRPAVRPKSFHASSIQNGDHSTNPNTYDSPPMRRKTCTDATPVEKPYDSPPRRQKSYETSVKKTPNGTSPSPERSFGTLRTAMSLDSLPTKDPINSDTSPGLRNGNKQNSYDMYLTSPGNHEATSPRSLKLDLGSLSPRSLDDPPVRKRSPRSRPSGGSKPMRVPPSIEAPKSPPVEPSLGNSTRRRRRPQSEVNDNILPNMPSARNKENTQRPVSCLIQSFNSKPDEIFSMAKDANRTKTDIFGTDYSPRTARRSLDMKKAEQRMRSFDSASSDRTNVTEPTGRHHLQRAVTVSGAHSISRSFNQNNGVHEPRVRFDEKPAPATRGEDAVVMRRKQEFRRSSPEVPNENGWNKKGSGNPERRSVLELTAMFAQNDDKETKKEVEEVSSAIGSSSVCCVCGRKLGVAERNTSQGHFFHRHCFHCTTCLTSLHMGTSVPEVLPSGKVRFYCYRHAYAQGLAPSNWQVPVSGVTVTVSEETDDESEDLDHSGASSDAHVSSPEPELDDLVEDEVEDDSGSDIDDLLAENEVTEDLERAAVRDRYLHDDVMDNAIELPCDSDGEVIELPDHYRTSRKRRNAQTESTLGIHAHSIRKMLAFETMRGLEELQIEQQDLEEEGMELETRLRQLPLDDPERDELMEQWLELLERKNEMTERENSYTLQSKMLELQDQEDIVKAQLKEEKKAEAQDALDGALKLPTQQRRKSCVELNHQMDALRSQMAQLSTYLEV